ncbi:HAD family phosphatase [Streptomyces sp. HNM0574]|uniref:HAD family hydrolase n=1 Tax=Streptomyces sp. HNM0574 TaxID=2714954 RepID=UPI00146C890F|nr:HAD family phosphatase [Streptomyces sp. HNM0574]NLU70571.1 HAD family phosphatase [Streptomyces sp. HNM0574]
MTDTATPAPAEAVIFDHDGVLIDSVRSDFLACSALFAEHGAELPAQVWAREVCGRPDAYPRLFALLPDPGPGKHPELKQRLGRLWERYMTPEHIRLLPGAGELLARLRDEGLPVAVASAADAAWVRRWLDHFRIAEYVDVVVGGDEVDGRKPDPAVYLEAAARLGVPPARCVAFEDSLTGIRAAQAAGITVTAVPTELTRSLDHSAADRVLPGLWAVGAEHLAPAVRTP